MKCPAQQGEVFEKGGGENQCQMLSIFLFRLVLDSRKYDIPSSSLSLSSLQHLFFDINSTNIVTAEINGFSLTQDHKQQYFFWGKVFEFQEINLYVTLGTHFTSKVRVGLHKRYLSTGNSFTNNCFSCFYVDFSLSDSEPKQVSSSVFQPLSELAFCDQK